MAVPRTTDPILSLVNAGELARAVGEHLKLARAGRAWTVEQSANAAGVPEMAVQEQECGRGSLEHFLAVASVLGFGHEIWNATRPEARSLDELERIEHAIAERTAGGLAGL